MPLAEDFLADAPAATSAEDFLADSPSAEDFLTEKPGAIAGTVNEFKRGLLAGQQQIIAAQRAASRKGPTLMQSRKAYVDAMSDPRYMEAVNAAGNDPAKLDRVENMLGPKAKLDRVRMLYDANRNIMDQQIAQLETEAQAIPQSEPMSEWGSADNSNWHKVLAKNPFEITAGIISQSLPAMAPAMAGNMLAPGGRIAKATATGVGSFGTEAANAYLDSARQTGYDLSDPDKVREFFDNPEAQAEAKAFAVRRGVPIAIFDAATMGLAGKFIGPAFKQGAKKVVIATGKEIGVQAAGGAAGELSAQVVSGQKISAKDIVAEALGEIGSGPQEAFSNLRHRETSNIEHPTPNIQRPIDDELPPSIDTFQGPDITGPLTSSEPLPDTVSDSGNNSPVPPGPTVPPGSQASPAFQESDQARANREAMEGLRRAKAANAPVAEPIAVLQAQLAAVKAGTKPAMLITPRTDGVDALAQMDVAGMQALETTAGVWVYPKDSKLTKLDIRQAVARDEMGKLLGMATPSKPADGGAVLQTRNAAGTPVLEEVISPATLPAAIEAGKAVAPEGTQQVVPAEQVIAERQASRQVESPDARRQTPSPRHLEEARAILSADVPPTVADELAGHGIARVQFEPADFGDLIATTREQLAQTLFAKPWNKLRKNQREKVEAAHALSTDSGTPADRALKTLSEDNPKYADWSVDELAQALAAAPRVQGKEFTRAERELAQQIAEAETGKTSNAEVTDFDQAAEATQREGLIRGSAAESWADSVIAEGQKRLHTGLDPELLAAYAVKGAALIEQGVTDFAAWSKAMVAKLGTKIQPHLEDIWRETRYQVAKNFNEREGTSREGSMRENRGQARGNGNGGGYVDYSMSVRANNAYSEGKLPASKGAKEFGISTALFRQLFQPSEWHHTSKHFNSTDFYDMPALWERVATEPELSLRIRDEMKSPAKKQEWWHRAVEARITKMYERLGEDHASSWVKQPEQFANRKPTRYTRLQALGEKYAGGNFSLMQTVEKRIGGGLLTDENYASTVKQINAENQKRSEVGALQQQVEAFFPPEMRWAQARAGGVVELHPWALKRFRPLAADIAEQIRTEGGLVTEARVLEKLKGQTSSNIMAGDARQSTGEPEGSIQNKSGPLESRQSGLSTSSPAPNPESPQGAHFKMVGDETKPQSAEPVKPDKVETFLDSLRLDPNAAAREGRLGTFGLLPWMSVHTWNGLIAVTRAAYRGTKSLVQAIQAGLEWLRAQNIAGYNEAEAKELLMRNLSVTPEDDDLNFREFADQLEADQPLPPDPARMVTNLLYDRRTNETDAAFAARIIQAVGGPQAAMEVFGDATNGLPGSVRMFLGQLIIKQLGATGQHEAAARFYDDQFAAHVTEVAQSLQSLNAFLALTPEGKVIWAKRKLARAAQDMIAPVTPDIEAARTELDAANAAGIEATTAAPDVQQAARAAVDEALQNQATTLGTELQEAIRREVLEQLRLAGLITQRELEITLLHLEAPGDTTLEGKLQSAGITDPKKRAQAILDGYKKRGVNIRDSVKSRAGKIRAQTKLGTTSPDNAVDAAIKKAMRELQIRLGKVIREHHTNIDATGRTLAQKIASEAGLSPDAASKLAETVRRRFALTVLAAKRKVLERLLRPVINRGLAKTDLAQKIIEATNLGALSAEQFWAAVRKGLKLPEFTPELAGQIRKQVDAIERIPDEQVERKQKAQTEMLNTIERAKGIDGLDLGLAFYMTNILTGVTTHAKNLLSTALNTAAALGIEGARAVASGHPSDIVLAFTALGEGMRQGGRAAADVLRTGVVTGSRLQKLEPGRTLEITRFGHRGGVPVTSRVTRAILENSLARVLNAWKYNYRLMAAEDLLFFKPAEEAKAALLAKRIARSEGLHGAAAQDRARVILGYGRAALDAAEVQAIREGLSGSTAKRRVAEILNAGRPEQLREDARQFALRTTFNNNPYGFMGAVAGVINKAKTSENRKLRTGANLIAPFTNIIANVVNESLNFTPVGFARSFPHGEKLLGRELSGLSLDERKDLQAELRAKALIGTVLLASLALKAASHLDDKDPEFAVYAGGPGSDEDRRGWQANGGLPHSMKIGDRYYSYANTPMALPLAWLGNIHDRMRDARIYQNRSAQRTAESLPMMAVNGALGMPKVITEQSFLSGIADVAQMISEPNAERASRTGLKTITRTISSALVPNLVRQMDKYFDPQVYEQRNAEGILVNAIPFVRGSQGQPMLNALGLPVQNPLAAAFTSKQGTDPIVQFLSETGNWPSTPNRNEIYARQGRSMTDAEFYQYVGSSGRLARTLLATEMRHKDWPGYDAEAQAKVVSRIFEISRRQTRGEMGF